MKRSASNLTTQSKGSSQTEGPTTSTMKRSVSVATTLTRVNSSIMKPFLNRVKAVGVRLVLLAHFGLVVWRVWVFWPDWGWWLGTAILPFVLEGLFIVVRRFGEERGIVSLSFTFYLLATVPGIWFLEIKRTNTYQSQNYTQVEDIRISGVDIPVRLSSNTWVLLVEEMMLYLLICGRGLLPRGEMGREQLIQLLFNFISKASDIMELFSLFDEAAEIRHNRILTYIILIAWTLSVFQFCLNFAASRRRTRKTDTKKTLKQDVLRLDLMTNLVSIFMQDGPFFAVRMYIIIQYSVITYSLVCFTIKNALVLLLLFYEIIVILNKFCCPSQRDDDDDDDDNEIGNKECSYGDEGRDGIQIRFGEQSNGRAPNPPVTEDLRKRKMHADDVVDPIGFSSGYVGDLQRAIEGPATPAKSMEKKKHSKYEVRDEVQSKKKVTEAPEEKKDDEDISKIPQTESTVKDLNPDQSLVQEPGQGKEQEPEQRTEQEQRKEQEQEQRKEQDQEQRKEHSSEGSTDPKGSSTSNVSQLTNSSKSDAEKNSSNPALARGKHKSVVDFRL